MSAQTEEEMRLGNVVHDLRAKLAAAEETIRKLHGIAWPRGGDLNGDPESDLLLMVGTFKCTISEMESKLAAAEKERDLPKGERDRAQATALAALADADRFRAERDAAQADFSAVVAELECEPTRADAVAAIGLLEHERDAALAQVATLTAELFEARRGATTAKVFADEKHAALAPTLRAIRELIVCPHPDIYGAREKIDGLLKMLVSP